jgi:hypothetical protein
MWQTGSSLPNELLVADWYYRIALPWYYYIPLAFARYCMLVVLTEVSNT